MSPFNVASELPAPPLSPDHLDSGRTNDPALHRVSRAEHVCHDELAVAVAALHESLVLFGIERLALRLDPVQPLGSQDVLELGVHELNAVEEPIEVRLLLGGHQSKVE